MFSEIYLKKICPTLLHFRSSWCRVGATVMPIDQNCSLRLGKLIYRAGAFLLLFNYLEFISRAFTSFCVLTVVVL